MKARLKLAAQTTLGKAIHQGVQATLRNLPAILSLQGLMALVVLCYYHWPAAHDFLNYCAEWQSRGGILAAACAAAFAGGVLSEISIVYLQNHGRWTLHHWENLGFKFVLFFISGCLNYEFYYYQAVWFGHGVEWSVILPKVFVDQVFYSPLWAVPFQTTAIRWQVLRYSGSRLWAELDNTFVVERLLPVMVTSWMFWIPGVMFVYSMPLTLQLPLAIFATASWGVLLAALAKPIQKDDHMVHPLILSAPEVLSDSDES